MEKLRRPLLGAAMIGIFTGATAAGPSALAGSFQVDPVNLAIPAEHNATSLRLKNSDSEPVAVRVLTYRWSQMDGKDVYAETPNVIASPPIFTIEPGKTQVVRVGLRSRKVGEAYRVVLEEIPRPSRERTQIQVALRLNLPLYVLAKEGEPELSWRAWRDASGELIIEASNAGSRHEKVLAIGAIRGSGEHLTLSEQMGVILPSSTRRWEIENPPEFANGSSITLKVRKSAGETQQNVLVEQR